MLLHAGADGEATDGTGATPADRARADGHLEVPPPERFPPLVPPRNSALPALIQPFHEDMLALEPTRSLILACAAKVEALLGVVATERARCIAFAMGLRERLGAGSLVRALDPEVVRMVLDLV